MSERTLSVLDGSTFLVGDRRGDMRAEEGREHGFFSEDTRFVSRWVLRVDAAPLQLLGLDQDAHYAARFFLAPGVSPDDAAPYSVMRRRLVDHVWMEEVTVTNHRHTISDLAVTLELDADFADLFEVKEGVVAAREVVFHHDDRTLVLAYENGSFQRSIVVTASRAATITREGFGYALRLAPGERWCTTFTATPHAAQPGATFPRRDVRAGLDELSRR
ncbi:MAG TPA: glycogen debranching N-terminal domain-containing protein, partial [Conexibacter sp.]